MENISNSLTINLYVIKTFIISICSYCTFLKIINDKKYFSINNIIGYILLLMMSFIVVLIKSKVNSSVSVALWSFLMGCIISFTTKRDIGYSIIVTVISLAFNYIIFFIAIVLTFVIEKVMKLENDYLNLMIITIVHIIILIKIFKLRKFKNGISFLQKNVKNEYLDILILNISVSILFFIIMFSNRKEMLTSSLFWGMIMTSLILATTVLESLQLYYKQKILVQELNETKEELENTKKELKQVEEENLKFSKKSHTLAHRQKSLEHKIQELVTKAEISTEEAGEVKDRLKEIEKDLYKETDVVELSKTEISEIDDMLKYMQSECIKNKIEFELQLVGNIHYMTNNLISKEDLEILLADHIKDAIIAINHTDNINRSILVRLGEIDGLYSLYIYDSGIEFEIETLKNLGNKPSTTHADEGGTGMGFMNTFDTLRKYKASLNINELSKPNKNNYTKVLIFKFDKKNEFNIISYRQEELNKRSIQNTISIKKEE